MGMFDTVDVININDDNLGPIRGEFQTKDLECNMSDYFIFNNRLWLNYDGEVGERLKTATDANFDGVLNVYSKVIEKNVERWVEYDLMFVDGELDNVSLLSDKITKDYRDLSYFKPSKPSNKVTVSIGIDDLDDKNKSRVLDKIESQLDALRTAIQDDDATIIYPVRTNGVFYKKVHSCVQRITDFKQADNKKSFETPRGDTISLILDEAGYYGN